MGDEYTEFRCRDCDENLFQLDGDFFCPECDDLEAFTL